MIDSNSEQFARMGNPWVSERERAEFSAPSKAKLRQNRNGPMFGKIPKLVEPRAGARREDCDAFWTAKRAQNFSNRFAAAMGGSRTVVGTVDPVRPMIRVINNDPTPDPLSRAAIDAQCERLARATATAVAENKARKEAAFAAAMSGLAGAMSL